MNTNLPPSTLLMGPSGSGKSSLIREAIEDLGSGLVIGAPGDDERLSYRALESNPNFRYVGFDDTEFQPVLGDWEARGYMRLLQFLKSEYSALGKQRAEQGEKFTPPYAVLGLDTISAIGRLVYNKSLAEFKIQKAPPAQSPDGAAFYGFLRSRQEDFMRLARGIRSYGIVLIAATHVSEKEVQESATAEEAKGKVITADLPGGFREVLPGFFDLVLRVGVKKVPGENGKGIKRVHYLQWSPDPKRVTKSRLGTLTPNGVLNNNWKELRNVAEF